MNKAYIRICACFTRTFSYIVVSDLTVQLDKRPEYWMNDAVLTSTALYADIIDLVICITELEARLKKSQAAR